MYVLIVRPSHLVIFHFKFTAALGKAMNGAKVTPRYEYYRVQAIVPYNKCVPQHNIQHRYYLFINYNKLLVTVVFQIQ